MANKTLLKYVVPTAFAVAAAAPTGWAQEQPKGQQTQQQSAKQSGSQQGAAMQSALVQLHAINQVESELALAGINQAQNKDVRELAKKIAKSHQENDRDLMEQAQKMGMDVVPSQQARQAIQQMEQQTQQLRSQLEQAQGQQFDRTFVQALVQTHQSALQQLRSQSRTVENQQLNKLIQSRISSFEDHLEEAQQLQQKLKTSGQQQ